MTRAAASGRALTSSAPADAAPGVTAVPLYWDPNLSVSLGPYLQLARPLGAWWSLTARASPGLSWIDERRFDGELVPDLSGRLGVIRERGRFRTSVEVFYGQGRFSGYRSFGVDVSLTARGWTGPGLGS